MVFSSSVLIDKLRGYRNMSEHEILIQVPFNYSMAEFEWYVGLDVSFRSDFSRVAEVQERVREGLSWDRREAWDKCFSDPEGYVAHWVLVLMCHPKKYEWHWNDTTHQRRIVLDPYFTDAFDAGLKRDWPTFESVLGLWELSEAKD